MTNRDILLKVKQDIEKVANDVTPSPSARVSLTNAMNEISTALSYPLDRTEKDEMLSGTVPTRLH